MRATFGVNVAITAAIVPFKIIALLRQSGVSVRCLADPQFAVINQAHVIHHHVMFHHGSQHVLSRTLNMFQNGSEHFYHVRRRFVVVFYALSGSCIAAVRP